MPCQLPKHILEVCAYEAAGTQQLSESLEYSGGQGFSHCAAPESSQANSGETVGQAIHRAWAAPFH